MTDQHLSPHALTAYTKRALSPNQLEHVDLHLTQCESCRNALLNLTADGSGLLRTIMFEAERHLSYEQLESLIDQHAQDALDALARQHLSACAVCQRELAELEGFDAMLTKTASTRAAAPPRPAPAWRVLFWPVTSLAGALGAALLVLVNSGLIPVGARSVQMVVALESTNAEESRQRVRSLTGNSSAPTLPADVARRLEDAIRRAASTREPQTIQFTVSAADYAALRKVMSALGRVGSEPAGASGDTRRQVEVSLTIQVVSPRP